MRKALQSVPTRSIRSRPGSPRRRAAALVALAPLLTLLCACVQEEHKGMDVSQPLPIRSDIKADQLALMASTPADGDGDGFPDQYVVEAYLTLNDPTFIEPVAIEGSFTFTITNESNTTIEHWVVPEQTTRLAVRTIRGLTTYRFVLEARRPAPGATPPRALTLHATFLPSGGGEPVRSGLTLPFGGR